MEESDTIMLNAGIYMDFTDVCMQKNLDGSMTADILHPFPHGSWEVALLWLSYPIQWLNTYDENYLLKYKDGLYEGETLIMLKQGHYKNAASYVEGLKAYTNKSFITRRSFSSITNSTNVEDIINVGEYGGRMHLNMKNPSESKTIALFPLQVNKKENYRIKDALRLYNRKRLKAINSYTPVLLPTRNITSIAMQCDLVAPSSHWSVFQPNLATVNATSETNSVREEHTFQHPLYLPVVKKNSFNTIKFRFTDELGEVIDFTECLPSEYKLNTGCTVQFTLHFRPTQVML